jgi:hypothetical protein
MLALAMTIALASVADEWAPVDTGLQAAFIVATVVDVLQTHDCLWGRGRKWDCYEANPFIGKHPSRLKLDLMAGSAIVVHTLVAYLLPRPWREFWQLAGLGIESAMATDGIQLGLTLRF